MTACVSGWTWTRFFHKSVSVRYIYMWTRPKSGVRQMDGQTDGHAHGWMVSFSPRIHFTQRWPRAILMSRAVRISDIRVEVKWTVMSSSTGMFISTNLWEKMSVFVIHVTTLSQILTTIYCYSLTDVLGQTSESWQVGFLNFAPPILST